MYFEIDPGIKEGKGLSLLREETHRFAEEVWMGPASITYDSPSQCDPVHKLKIDEILATLYFQFDMKLNVKEVQKEY